MKIQYYSHTCKCGCGGQIEVKRWHKWDGIPKFVKGHHFKNSIGNESSFAKGHKPWNKGKKGFPSSEETKEKMREKRKLQIITEDHRQNIAKALKGIKRTEAFKKEKAVQAKQQWQDPEFVKKQMKSRNVMPNKAEMSLQDIINSVFFIGQFIYVGDGEEIIGGKCPDFIDPINNKIIELYGDYWHKGQDPNDRINYFKQYGYNTLIVWESELKNAETLKTKLIGFSINKQEVQKCQLSL